MEQNQEEKKVGLRLEERDYELLGALEKWGVLGFGQLDGLIFRKGSSPLERVRLFFGEVKRSDYWLAAYKRLHRLEKEGFIQLGPCQWHPRYYLLTRKGHRYLKWQGQAAMRHYRRHMPEYFLRHEILVNAVGLILTELIGAEVWTAREWFAYEQFDFRKLRGSARLIIPDLRIVDRDRPIAIEVERNQKSDERYERIWRAYAYHWPENGVVLYLVTWPSGHERLIELARSFRREFIYVAPLDEFRRYQGRCAFLRRRPECEYGGYEEFWLKKPLDPPAIEFPLESPRGRAAAPSQPKEVSA